MTLHWRDTYGSMVEDCMEQGENLTEWEWGFLESIELQLANERVPTAKQVEKLEQIWEKVTRGR